MNYCDYFRIPNILTMELLLLPKKTLLLIMAMCSGRDLLSLSLTCKMFNDFLTNDAALMKKIQFKIDLLFNVFSKEMFMKKLWSLMELIANNRIRYYRNLELKVSTRHITVPDDWKLLGTALKAFEKVKILKAEFRISSSADSQLLNSFAQVEELEVEFCWSSNNVTKVFDEARASMINLKKLTYIGDCITLKYFENCTSLTDCELAIDSDSQNIASIAEEFFLKQNNLKNLKLKTNDGKSVYIKLFQHDRSVVATFELDSLSIESDACGKNMHKFIAQQKSLAQCTFNESHMEPGGNNDVMRAMLMLPRLKLLTIKSVVSVTALKDIRNTTVKQLNVNIDEDENEKCFASDVLESLVLICPNAEIITSNLQIIKLKDFPSEVLHKLQLPECRHFYYQPKAIPEDQHAFEEHVMAFIRRFKKITKLTIGHGNWLFYRRFGLSLGFIKDLLRNLPDLKKFKVCGNAAARQFLSELTLTIAQLKKIIVVGEQVYAEDDDDDNDEEEEEESTDDDD